MIFFVWFLVFPGFLPERSILQNASRFGTRSDVHSSKVGFWMTSLYEPMEAAKEYPTKGTKTVQQRGYFTPIWDLPRENSPRISVYDT